MMDQYKSVLQDKKEYDRIKNKIDHNLELAEITSLHKAIKLGFYELLGDVEWINQEAEKYNQISVEQLQNRAKDLFRREKASIIYYEPKKLKQNLEQPTLHTILLHHGILVDLEFYLLLQQT
jgi:predicted Zn-dependent peptidase